MEIMMTSQIKKIFLKDIGSSRTKMRLVKAGCVILLMSLSFVEDVHASQRRHITENDLFDVIHSNFQGSYREARQEMKGQQALREQEIESQQARKVINGVIAMYREDVTLGNITFYNLKIGDIVTKLNASYTHATRTFNFPHILQNVQKIIYTAKDQGIVSHEAGHMVLNYLCTLSHAPHAGAFHEAFADLTSHFYNFYNPETRQRFLVRLNWGQGCVGDSDFTCIRDSYQPLTLSHVNQDQALCEVHDFSKTFSSAVYRSMVDAFANRDANSIDEYVAANIVKWHKRILAKAVLSIDYSSPTLMDVAAHMLKVSLIDPKYRDGLGDNFISNGLIVLMYRNLPNRYDRDPDTYYCPNEDFAMLCLAEKNIQI